MAIIRINIKSFNSAVGIANSIIVRKDKIEGVENWHKYVSIRKTYNDEYSVHVTEKVPLGKNIVGYKKFR